MTTQTSATGEIEKWLHIRFVTNFWHGHRKKNAESCRRQLRIQWPPLFCGRGPQRWSYSVFFLSDPILFLKNVIHIRSESWFGWHRAIRIRKCIMIHDKHFCVVSILPHGAKQLLKLFSL